MFDPYTFLLIFCLLYIASFLILFAIVKRHPALRKAWIIYSVMYVLHFCLFGGVWMARPSTFPVYRSKVEQIETIETNADARNELRSQRESIETLTNDLYQLNRTVDAFLWMLLLLGPLLYYNMIKYNLEIEKLSGKRMGSFD